MEDDEDPDGILKPPMPAGRVLAMPEVRRGEEGRWAQVTWPGGQA